MPVGDSRVKTLRPATTQCRRCTYVDEAGKQQEKAYSCKAFHNGKEEQHIKEDPCEGGHDDEQGPEVIPGKENDHDDAEQAEPGLKPVKA